MRYLRYWAGLPLVCGLALPSMSAPAPPAPGVIRLPQLAGWRLQPSSPAPVSALLHEFGLIHRYAFQARHGALQLNLQADLFGDASGAYGAFTFRRPAAASRLRSGCRLSAASNYLALACDRWLVRARTSGRIAPNLVAHIVSWSGLLPRWNAPGDQLPSIVAYAPRRKRIPGSLRYCFGPTGWALAMPWAPVALAGFNYTAEAAVASYSLPRQSADFAIVSYPTPQIAHAQLRRFRDALKNAHPPVQLRRSGSFLLMVRGGSFNSAARLLAGVHENAIVTWSQPVPANISDVAALLLGILLLTASLLLVALVVGVLSGWLHARLARMFPRLFTYREHDLIRLDLD